MNNKQLCWREVEELRCMHSLLGWGCHSCVVLRLTTWSLEETCVIITGGSAVRVLHYDSVCERSKSRTISR